MILRGFLLFLVSLLCRPEYRLASFYYNPYDNLTAQEKIKMYPLFYSLNDVLLTLNEEAAQYPDEVSLLYEAFRYKCNMSEEVYTFNGTRRKPFIVIEGKHGPNNEGIAKRLASRLQGVLVKNPPPCLVHLINYFPRGTRLRSAYFGLCFYASAYYIAHLLDRDIPVVLKHYWTDYTAFILSRQYFKTTSLPPRGSPVYNFPKDLLAPDILYYVDYAYEKMGTSFVRITTPFPNFKSKKMIIYERYNCSKKIKVSANRQFYVALDMIYNTTYDLFAHKYNMTYNQKKAKRSYDHWVM